MAAALLSLAGGACGDASAQTLPQDQSLVTFDRYVSVTDRQLAGYAAPTLQVGAFSVQPALGGTALYNDNVLALDNGAKGDTLVRLSPGLSANSNWSSSLLSINASADVDRYVQMTTENSVNLNTSAYATHDFGASTRLRGIARFQTLRESRDSQDVFVLTERPVRYRTETAGLGINQRFANVLLLAEADLTHSDYDDATSRTNGAPVDEDFRDSTLRQVRARAEFGESPAVAYFAQMTYGERKYSESASDPLAEARSSKNLELLGGVRFELPILARGEIGVGYTSGEYRSAQLNKFSGLAIRSKITFFPTQLTNIVVSAARQVTDTGVPSSGGYSSLQGGIHVDHELLRPLLLSAGIAVERDGFNGVDRTDRRYQADIGASYRLNQYLAAKISVQRLDLSSRGADRYKSFVANQLLFGIQGRL